MLCDHCRQRPATLHQTIVVNGVARESHLCETCAREHSHAGIGAGANFAFPNLSIQQLLSSFLGQEIPGAPFTKARAQKEPQCKNCGMTYSEFAESGRLGCSQCYDDLEPHLNPLIKRIQGTTQHTGKAPKRTGGIVRQKRELVSLRDQLQAAITAEQFEEAARLRDRIRQMELEIQAGGVNSAVE